MRGAYQVPSDNPLGRHFVRLNALKNSREAMRIFVKNDVWEFYENLLGNFIFHLDR
jgi:hypothetical protein